MEMEVEKEEVVMGAESIEPEIVHPATLEPETPLLITQLLSGIVQLVSNFGWPCLVLALVAAFLYNKYKKNIQQWQQKREDQKEAALYHKNPDIMLAREAAVEKARLKMQEKYAAASAEHAEKMQAKEEERRRAKLAEAEAMLRVQGGRRLRATETQDTPTPVPEKRKAKFRPEYNPLFGSGPSSGFRPARRGGAAGGG